MVLTNVEFTYGGIVTTGVARVVVEVSVVVDVMRVVVRAVATLSPSPSSMDISTVAVASVFVCTKVAHAVVGSAGGGDSADVKAGYRDSSQDLRSEGILEYHSGSPTSVGNIGMFGVGDGRRLRKDSRADMSAGAMMWLNGVGTATVVGMRLTVWMAKSGVVKVGGL